MKTLEHLAGNGGLRGHSVGDIYPWRIMAQGTFEALVWWVVNPQGKKVSKWATPEGAQAVAELTKAGYLRG